MQYETKHTNPKYHLAVCTHSLKTLKGYSHNYSNETA